MYHEEATLRLMRVGQLFKMQPSAVGGTAIGIMAGIKLAREHPDLAEAILIHIGIRLPPESLTFLANAVTYIESGETPDAEFMHLMQYMQINGAPPPKEQPEP